MEINERIKELRIEQGIKQNVVASALHIAPNTLCQYEKGTAKPSIEVLCAIADFYGVTLDQLLGRADEFGVVNLYTDLTPEETDLLTNFRASNKEQRNALLTTARSFATK